MQTAHPFPQSPTAPAALPTYVWPRPNGATTHVHAVLVHGARQDACPGHHPRKELTMPDTPSTPTFSKKDQARIQRLLATPFPCLLCGTSRAEHAGVFFPQHPEVWGQLPAKRGTMRMFGYRLCKTCFALPGREMAVEARIQASLGARRNEPRGYGKETTARPTRRTKRKTTRTAYTLP